MADFDVVIVGAGIAGTALAARLAGTGLSLALVEAQPLDVPELPQALDIASFDPRVSALTPRSQVLLEDIGAWDAIADYRLCTYRHMTVWDADGTGVIEFDQQEIDAQCLGHIVENRAIVAALLQVVASSNDITQFGATAVAACERTDSGALTVALADGRELRAGLVVAADGAQSRLRSMMNFTTREWDYGHRAIVATVQLGESHRDTAWQRFMPTGPLALLPLPGTSDQHYCSIVWSAEEALANEIMDLDDVAFCTRLGRASEHCLGEVLASSARSAFPLRQRHAVDYVQPGVALVADAAHTIHPLAGQGINLGLADVAALAEEIFEGVARGAAPGDLAVLKRYQRQRKGENLLMMAAMDGFKRLFEQDALPLRWLRNTGLKGVNQLVPVKQQLMRHALGLG
ncbi:MAG: UbiH/UbiF/VisC/COQ6 family ubiquinone biosynthesis hydroxylase [Halioglobus sp.]|nr:UbiH/UbiF/VisC/COQ6 family ubiquinone biosynthesis hydroxylase [Halioglobus sp.]